MQDLVSPFFYLPHFGDAVCEMEEEWFYKTFYNSFFIKHPFFFKFHLSK